MPCLTRTEAMPLLSSRKVADREAKQGLTRELQDAGIEAAQLAVENAKMITVILGAPWGARHLTQDESRAYLDAYEDPAKVETVRKWTDAQLVKAALDAVKMRSEEYTSEL